VPQGEPSAVGAKTPNRRLKAKAHRTPGPAGEGATPVAGGVPAEATTTPKKRPVRKAKEGVKERAAAVGDQLEAEDGAPAEVRTKVHRPKRVPKKQHPAPAAPAPSPAPVAIQQGQPEEAA
jgi:hypothetical protein